MMSLVRRIRRTASAVVLGGLLTLMLNPVAGGETKAEKGPPLHALGSEDATPIEYGDCVSASLPQGQINEYSFEAEAGDIIVLCMSVATNWSWDVNPHLKLYRPGMVLEREGWTNGYQICFNTDTLIEGGTYTIRARDHGGNNAGNYGISLQVVSRQRPGSNLVESGYYHTSGLSTGCLVSYQFLACKGNLLTLGASVSSDWSWDVNPRIWLYGPDGLRASSVQSTGLQALLELRADTSGLYTALVSDIDGKNSGNYAFNLLIGGPCDTTFIDCPASPYQIPDSMVGGEVCVPLYVLGADTVDVESAEAEDATWANGELCFDAPNSGTYNFAVYAESESTADTCHVTVMVGDTLPPVCVPPLEHDVEVCALGYVVGVPIQIQRAATVGVSNNASLLNDTLYFVPTRAGTHYFHITASNQYGTTNCEAVVDVEWRPEIDFSVDVLTFWTTTGDIEVPGQQVVHVSSPTCEDSLVEWQLSIEGGADWLQLDKETGTVPDSVIATVTRPGAEFEPGVYDARLVFEAGSSSEVPVVLNVVLFVESGIDIGEDRVNPGDTGLVPIVLFTEDSLSSFTLPFNYAANPDEVWLDSILLEPSLNLNVENYFIDSATGEGLLQIVQDPPLPPDTPLTVGWLQFITVNNAALADVPIDTATLSLSGIDYAYEFERADGTIYTPSFSAGKLVIGRASRVDTGTDPYCYPNPFNPEREPTHLCFFPDGAVNVTIKIYDTGGKLVRTVADLLTVRPGANGIAEVSWDGKNGNGEYVANGVYFFVAEKGNGGQSVGKIAVLR